MSDNESTTTETAEQPEATPLSPEQEAFAEEVGEALKDVIDPSSG